MKLIRFGNPNQEAAGILDDLGQLRDISATIKDLDPACLTSIDILTRLQQINLKQCPIINENTRLGPCIKPGKIICIGFNSKLHNQQLGYHAPKKDIIVFMKPVSSICGAFDAIWYTRHMQKLDWEAELGVVIGKKGKYITEEEARGYIFGYTCVNDLSDRFWQFETEDTQFTKGKCFDNAAPIGPYLVTKDEIPDSSNLKIQLWVNDVLRQDFNTADYIHNDAKIISYLSQFFTLYPGDLISMGSAPGNAISWGDAYFLKPNDTVELSITGLGKQSQRVIIEP